MALRHLRYLQHMQHMKVNPLSLRDKSCLIVLTVSSFGSGSRLCSND